MSRHQLLLCMGMVVCAVACFASDAFGTVITTVDTQTGTGADGWTPTYVASTTDLINGVSPSASAGDFTLESSGGLPVRPTAPLGRSACPTAPRIRRSQPRGAETVREFGHVHAQHGCQPDGIRPFERRRLRRLGTTTAATSRRMRSPTQPSVLQARSLIWPRSTSIRRSAAACSRPLGRRSPRTLCRGWPRVSRRDGSSSHQRQRTATRGTRRSTSMARPQYPSPQRGCFALPAVSSCWSGVVCGESVTLDRSSGRRYEFGRQSRSHRASDDASRAIGQRLFTAGLTESGHKKRNVSLAPFMGRDVAGHAGQHVVLPARRTAL